MLLPASFVYDGIGSLVLELVMPVRDPVAQPIQFANSILLTGVLGFLGSYAIAAGLLRIALGQHPSPLDVIAAPWREAQWALPVAFVFSFITLAGYLLGVLPALLAQMLLLVAGPVAAVERTGTFATLRRAFALAEGHRLRAAALYCLVLLGMVGSSLPLVALGASDAMPAITLAACLQALVAYFGDTAVFLFYAELRVRKDSFDLELLARDIEEREGGGPGDTA